METICKYCNNSFVPKRTDSLYCSHSCRQLAYVLRKANSNSTDGLKGMTYKSDDLVLQPKQEPSIDRELIKNYPSTEIKNEAETVNILTDKKQGLLVEERKLSDFPSTSVKQVSELSVNPDKKEFFPNTIAVNTTIKAKEEQEKYIEYSSPLVNEIAELTEERNNLHTLYLLLHNKTESSAYWVSLRYRCLVECLLTLSEMQAIDLDDLKEVCNAFTSLIKSKSFSYLIPEYPYTKEIVWLHDTIKNICINADEEEPIELRFKKETKLRLITTRWEMANYVPRIPFNQLNFTE